MVKVGSILLAVLMPWLAIPVLGGVLLAGRLSRGFSLRAATRGADGGVSPRPAGVRAGSSLEYDRRRGWNVSALPLDMIPDLSGRDRSTAMFTCAGIGGLVRGVASGGSVTYSFSVGDEARALEIQRKAGAFPGARVERSPGGGFIVSAPGAAAINELAKAAFPLTAGRVEREVRLGRQYVMRGYGSYDEALSAFRDGLDRPAPENTYVAVTDSVDGKAARSDDGVRLEPAELPEGVFIINEEEVSRFAGRVSFPYGDVSARDAALEAWTPSVDDRMDVPRQERTVISDGTPPGVTRVVPVAGDDGGTVNLALSGAEALLGLSPYIEVGDASSLGRLLCDGAAPCGAGVVLSGSVPPPSGGRFYVELPRSAGTVSSLRPVSGVSDAFVERCAAAGIPATEAGACLLWNEVRDKGSARAVLTDPVPLDGALVNGVPAAVVAERLSSWRLPSLAGRDLETWLSDAGKIQAVNITVDVKRAEMRVVSVVDDTQKVETRKLSDKELRAFSERGKLDRAEMRDLLMMAHPDYFRSYSRGGRSVVDDPVGAFLLGAGLSIGGREEVVKRGEERRALSRPARRNGSPRL